VVQSNPWKRGQHTNAYNDITLYAVNGSPNYYQTHSRVIIHELGHAFNRATDRDAEGSVGGDLLRDADGDHVDEYGRYYGFAGGWDDWQYGYDNNQSEVFADMFVGWAYNSWDLAHPESLGLLRQAHMNIYMANWFKP
jgi:hypothetical protein